MFDILHDESSYRKLINIEGVFYMAVYGCWCCDNGNWSSRVPKTDLTLDVLFGDEYDICFEITTELLDVVYGCFKLRLSRGKFYNFEHWENSSDDEINDFCETLSQILNKIHDNQIQTYNTKELALMCAVMRGFRCVIYTLDKQVTPWLGTQTPIEFFKDALCFECELVDGTGPMLISWRTFLNDVDEIQTQIRLMDENKT